MKVPLMGDRERNEKKVNMHEDILLLIFGVISWTKTIIIMEVLQ